MLPARLYFLRVGGGTRAQDFVLRGGLGSSQSRPHLVSCISKLSPVYTSLSSLRLLTPPLQAPPEHDSNVACTGIQANEPELARA